MMTGAKHLKIGPITSFTACDICGTVILASSFLSALRALARVCVDFFFILLPPWRALAKDDVVIIIFLLTIYTENMYGQIIENKKGERHANLWGMLLDTVYSTCSPQSGSNYERG